jgi:CRP/FNR family transcriptional regulator
VIQEDLQRAPLFASLPPDELAELAALARPVRLPAHQVVFSQGDQADAFYLVSHGRVRVFKVLRDGRALTLRHVGHGETFGEAALFAAAYPAFAQTMEAARLYRIRIEPFRRLLAERPGLALNLLATQAHLMVLLSQRVEELLLPVPARLARYLLDLSTQQGSVDVRLPVPKHELANLLGTVPETLSRVVTRLARSRLIRRRGETIEILDLEGLDRLAQLQPGNQGAS